MVGLIVTVVVLLSVVDAFFRKTPEAPAETLSNNIDEQNIAKNVVNEEDEVIADDQELIDKLREALPDMTSFLNVMVGKRIFRLEQINDDVVRIRECLKDVVGQIRYSNCCFENGTLYSVSNDMLWNEK